MDINIMKLPSAIWYFVIGSITTVVVWILVPIMLDTMHTMNLFADSNNIDQVIWFGVVVICILITLGLPLWIIFEKDEVHGSIK